MLGRLPGGEPAAAHAEPHARPADRPGQGDGAAADRPGRRAGRPVGPRDAPPGPAPARPGARPGRAGRAARGASAGGAGRPGRQGRPPDRPAHRGREDHRPPRVDGRPRRRPIRKGKLRQPTEFGYVVQICEITENTRRGARGLILPAPSKVGSPNESDLLPATFAELDRLGIVPREIALDGGFQPSSVDEHLPARERTFIAGRQSAGSRRTDRRPARYRVGAEGRISYLKRGYGLGRSRLKGHGGARTWSAWSILVYNLDTLAIRTA
jgi:hypothetical protein